jgi:hypothetical protein
MAIALRRETLFLNKKLKSVEKILVIYSTEPRLSGLQLTFLHIYIVQSLTYLQQIRTLETRRNPKIALIHKYVVHFSS